MPVTGFHHVALRARDFEKSHGFYTNVLGLTEKVTWGEAPKRAAMLDMGGAAYVEIFERPDQPPADEKQETALLHFALRTDDPDGMLARAKAAGCKVRMEPKDIDIPTTTGPLPVRIAFFWGPDNEVVELFRNDLT